mmetsp:Transcript_14526/g.23090  ORF Transcript_14526/g.23090 Transcript_14526/m.23090 type:complete len:569 (+) Transcript_14526:48-1754(+)
MPTQDPITLTSHDKRYHVPIVLHNLPRVQALQQALDSLEHLDKTIDDAFSRVSARIAIERQKFEGIVKRVDVCRSKVETLEREGKKRATTVFSACKYPAPESLPAVGRLYNEDTNHLSRPSWTSVKLTQADNNATAERANTSELFIDLTKLLEKNSPGEEEKRKRQSAKEEGLGKLPGYLPSVSSTLLFNSSENPYKDYSSFDNLVSALTKEKDVVQDQELAAAPLTLVEGADLPSFDNPMEALKYNPQIEELPTLDLPENLPLGQLADISFLSQMEGSSIAPSLGNLKDLNMTDLKDLPPIAGPSKKQPQQGNMDLPELPDIDLPPAGGTSDLPSGAGGGSIPPPPVAAGGGAPGAASGIPPPPMQAGIPPPPSLPPVGSGLAPPPQMDGGLPPPPSATPAAEAPAPSSSDGGGGGGRNDLLMAIRAGKKLKKASKKSSKAKKKQEPPPMDMMGQLRARLARHRKAIGGKVEIKRQSLAIPSTSKLPKRSLPRRNTLAPSSPRNSLPNLDDGPSSLSEEKHASTGDALPSLDEADEQLSTQILTAKPPPRIIEEDDDDDDDDGWEST